MTTLTISPHMRCVGACSHCGVESTRKDTRTLPDEVVRRLVDEACTTPEIELVSFYGGEPMLRADFILELCAKLTEHGKPTLHLHQRFLGCHRSQGPAHAGTSARRRCGNDRDQC